MQYIVNPLNHNGFILPLLIMLPNLLWMIWPPRNVPEQAPEKRSRIYKTMEILEGTGRIAVFIVPLFYSIHVKGNIGRIVLGFLVLMLLIYYIGWMRFFGRERRYELLFAPLFGIPVPLAIAPVLFFLAGAWVTRSWLLLVGTAVLGIGHIYISFYEYWEIIGDK